MKHLIAFLLPAVLSLSAAIPEPVLKADFDGKTDGGTVKGKVSYAPGVRGLAAKLADGIVTFPAAKGVTAESGTVTVWIKPVNWKWSKKNFITFVGAGKSYSLYKFHLPLGLLMKYGHGPKSGKGFLYVNRKAEKLPDGQWLALGATWSRKQHLLALYINGEKVSSLKIPATVTADDPGAWVLNGIAHNPSDRSNATLFDMFRVYDRALSDTEMEELYAKERPSAVALDPELLQPIRFNLPRLAAAPKIDGNVDEREWEGAVKIGGFSANAPPMLDTAYPGDAYMGYFGDKLYVCCVFQLMDPTRIVADKTRRDDPVGYDDSAEFVVRPDNMEKGFYQGIFNSRCAIFDQKSGKTAWNGKWEVKANVYEGMLNIEFAIPASELKSSIRDGAVWRMNLARNRIVERAVVFSTISPFLPGEYFSLTGKARFVDAGLFGRLTLDYHQLFNRRLELKYQVVNRSEKAAEVDFCAELIAPDGKTLKKEKLAARIPARGSHVFSWSDPLQGVAGALLRLTAAESGAKEPFYSQDLPLIFKDEFRITDETDLKNNTLTVSVDCTSHRQTVNAAEVAGTLAGRTVEFTGLPQAKGVFDLAGLAPGDYTIELVFRDKTGKELLRHKRPYGHIGQPEWLKKHPGTNMGVVWPYTPLKLENNVFEVWGRSHKFGKNLLPDAIVTQRKELFSAPPRLLAVVDGKKHTVDNFKFTVKERKPDRAVMAFTGSAGKVKFEGTAVMEFDGLIWYEFDMTGPAGTKIDDLRLVIPLAPGIAEFYNAHYFARERSGGRLTTPLALKRYPSLWAGNCDVGFSFMLESYKSWRNADVNKVFEFTADGKGVDWTVRMIDRPVKLERVFHYGFGIEANPVKPVPAWRRNWRIGPHKPQNIMHPWAFDRKNTKKYPGWGGFYTPVFKSMDVFRGLVKQFKAKGVDFSVYLNPGLVSTDSTEYKIFHKEWTNPYNCYPMCPNSTFTDFIVWCIDGLLKNGLKAVYVDSLGSVNCYNPRHGCGYIDEETGETGLTWPIRGMRNYMKRLYSLMHPYDGRNQREYFLWAHTSARNCAAINAFADSTCGGEEQEQRAAVNPNYLELYPLDEFQAYYNHTLAGVGMMNSNLGRIGDKSVRLNHAYNDQVFLLLLIHDVQTWPLYLDFPYANRFFAMLDKWGYGDETLKFYGFRTQKMIVSPDADIHVSVYTLPDRALAVVGNWQNKARKVSVKIDNKALGLGDDLSFTDLRSGKQVDPDAIELPGYNFILMDIRKK